MMRHILTINQAPQFSGKRSVPDGAVNGNGDVGIILGNSANGMRVYLSKCDLWMGVERHDTGGLKPLGYVDVDIPAPLYAHYCVLQDMDRGELRCRFADGAQSCEVHLRVCKTENTVMIESVGDVPIAPRLCVFAGETAGEKGTFAHEKCSGIYRIFAGADHAYETHGYAALRQVDANTWVLPISTDHDIADPKADVLHRACAVTTDSYAAMRASHYAAWEQFWSLSAFTLADATLENDWYASQYLLAGCAGNVHFPPGLYANFVTVESPSWHSDYHLNYNYQAPFYAACSSNHVQLTDGYHAPLEEFMQKGRAFAERMGARGILYPVGIAPKGLCSELDATSPYSFERLFLGQKSNAVHPANIMIFRWNATRDVQYARDHAYAYVKACLEFFETYAVYENGRLSIDCDAVHEVPYYKSDFDSKKYRRYIHGKNNVLTLGMLRLCLAAAIDMAQTLDIDADKRRQWQAMQDALPAYPTMYRRFRKVFRYTEKGQRWNDGGDVGLQHIYPGGAVGLSSDPQMLKIACATFRQKARYCYRDENAISSFYPMAARLGIEPKEILRAYRALRREKMQPNGILFSHAGCLENCSIAASMLNEMALQSHQGIVRLFPTWDRTLDAAYRDLRADGAFLVSAAMRAGRICDVRIVSEQGQTLRLANPYKKAILRRQDGTQYVFEDETITMPTQKGDTLTLTEG